MESRDDGEKVVDDGGGEQVVKLFGSWGSSYTQRVQVALKLKGVDFEYVEEEDLSSSKESRSLLYKYNPNPVYYKKVPVLLHGHNPLAESIVILQYIDETWSHIYPLMPVDPYERALVRFWSHFADDKLGPSVGAVFRAMAAPTTNTTKGEGEGEGEGGGNDDHEEEEEEEEEELGVAVEEVRKNLRVVEEEMEKGWFKGRRYFGGDDRVGILDLVIGCGSHWIWALEEAAGISLVDQTTFPRFHSWLRDLEQLPEFTQTVPPAHQLLDMLLRGSTTTTSSSSSSFHSPPRPPPTTTDDHE